MVATIEHILGWHALLAAAALTAWLARRYPALAWALAAAFAVRALAALCHYYVVPLPSGVSDAVNFERLAWHWSREGLSAVWGHFPGASTDFYSWLLALLYALTERSPLMAQALSVMAGVAAVPLVWRLAGEMWGPDPARKAAWLMALFPTAVQYSALTLREAFIVLLVLWGLLHVMRWARERRLAPALVAIVAFTAATFFHGAMLVALAAFGLLVVLRESYLWLSAWSRARIQLVSTVLVAGTALGGGALVAYNVQVPKLGEVATAITPEHWFAYVQSIERAEDATARYPDWTLPQSTGDLVWAVPVRAAYFAFSPFPWDLRQPSHLIGLVDAAIYVALAWLLWRHRRAVWADPGARAVLLMTLAMALVFSIGTGNFATAMRHRAKFVGLVLALVAPRLPHLLPRTLRRGDLVPARA